VRQIVPSARLLNYKSSCGDGFIYVKTKFHGCAIRIGPTFAQGAVVGSTKSTLGAFFGIFRFTKQYKSTTYIFAQIHYKGRSPCSERQVELLEL
jgi:hypothetical protein